jgi:hypothetical protein
VKREWLLQRTLQIATSLLVTVVLLACATVANAQGVKGNDKWQFTITPYVWVPSITGSLQFEPPPGFGRGGLDVGPE